MQFNVDDLKNNIPGILNFDLKNELKHLHFYLQAGVMIQGLHREELKEFLLKEAESELEHCKEFAELVVYFGGVPTTEFNPFPTDLVYPTDILNYAMQMEQEVAENYAERLRLTHEMENAGVSYLHVFYEDQISDSQKTAWEIKQMLGKVV